MKKTIYNVAVLMDSQETCNRMRQLCIDNGLPIWEDEVAFSFDFFSSEKEKAFFGFFGCEFYVVIDENVYQRTIVTESEFIELLKQEKA
jgi:hypothetical protein